MGKLSKDSALSTATFTHTDLQERRGRYNTDLGYLSTGVIPPCVRSFLANNLPFPEEDLLLRHLIGNCKKAKDDGECMPAVWDC